MIMEKQKILRGLLVKMFKIIGQEYSEDKCKEEGWFTKHTWTAEQEQKFAEWGKKFLKKHMKLNDKCCKKEMSYFILNYGWKTK